MRLLLIGLMQVGACLSLSLPNSPPRVGDLIVLETLLAHVSAVQQSKLTCHILTTRATDDPESNGDVKFYYDEDREALDLVLENSSALSVLDPADVLLSQRQVPDRRSNPHSEESEDVFFVRGAALRWETRGGGE